MNLRERIDAAPMTRYQWLIVGLCFTLNALDGFDVMAMAFTGANVQSEFGLSGSQLGYLLSAGLIGMAVGSIFLAPFADRAGRRPIILLSVALATAGMLLSATATSATTLGLWRVVTGLGVGGILACTTVIASEYSNARWRGLAIAIYTAGYGVGATIGGLIAVSVQGEFGWRSVFLLGGLITGAVLVVLVMILPESVEFLLTANSENALAKINRVAKRLGQEPLSELVPVSKSADQRSRVGELFSPATRLFTIMVWVAFFSLMFAFYFVNSWTPTLLAGAGMTKEQGVTVGLMLAAGGTIGSLAYGVLTSRFNARVVLLAFTTASAIAMAVFVSMTSVLLLAFAFGLLVGLLVNGCMAGLYALAPSGYPTRARSTGVGSAIGIGRAGAILAPIMAGNLLDAGWSAEQLYVAVGGVLLVTTLAVALATGSRDRRVAAPEPQLTK